MKKLQNVLYITSPESYLSLDGETVVVKREEQKVARVPLHNLESIVCFSYPGVSPALMGACADRNLGLCFLKPSGRFLARVTGRQQGNVLLRKKQYTASEDTNERVRLGISFLLGKIANCRVVIERARRDHAMLVDMEALGEASNWLSDTLKVIQTCDTTEELMGFEGSAAKVYFGLFNQLILHQKKDFMFQERSRRPPLDKINALLSYFYTMLTYQVASALEVVGLDPYVGFLHRDRPGRPSLALDLMEELRPVFADRLTLTLINRKQVKASGFVEKESGGVLMNDETRKEVITSWQERKKEEITHPYLKEKIPFGLLPHVQAMLLARYLRGDLDTYPPFFWN